MKTTMLLTAPKRTKNIIGAKEIKLRTTSTQGSNKYFPNYHELDKQQLTDLKPATAREARDVADLWLGLDHPDEALKVLVKQFNSMSQRPGGVCSARPDLGIRETMSHACVFLNSDSQENLDPDLDPDQISAAALQQHLSNSENALVRTELANLSLKMVDVMSAGGRIIREHAAQYLALLDECAQYLSSKQHQISKVKGDISMTAAKPNEALEHYNVTLEYYTQNKAGTYKTVEILRAIGLVHFAQGNSSAAEEVIKKALDLQQQIGLPQDHPERAKLCTLLAMILNQQACYANAIMLLDTPKKTFALKIIPCDHDKHYFSAKVEMYKALMTANLGVEKPNLAQEDFAALFKLYSEKYGEVHHKIGSLYNFTGLLLMKNNKLDGARQSYNQALKIGTALDMANPLNLAALSTTYHGMAITQLRQGELNNAIASSKRFLELQIKIFGEGHRRIVDSYMLQSLIYTKANDLTAALIAHEEALKILIPLGTEHFCLMISYSAIAQIYLSQNKPKLAIINLTLAVAQLEKKLKLITPNEPMLEICMSFVEAHQQLYNFSRALEYLVKAKAIAKALDDNQAIISIQEKQEEIEKLALASMRP